MQSGLNSSVVERLTSNYKVPGTNPAVVYQFKKKISYPFNYLFFKFPTTYRHGRPLFKNGRALVLTTYQNQLSNYTKSIPKVQRMLSGILVLTNIVLFLWFFLVLGWLNQSPLLFLLLCKCCYGYEDYENGNFRPKSCFSILN